MLNARVLHSHFSPRLPHCPPSRRKGDRQTTILIDQTPTTITLAKKAPPDSYQHTYSTSHSTRLPWLPPAAGRPSTPQPASPRSSLPPRPPQTSPAQPPTLRGPAVPAHTVVAAKSRLAQSSPLTHQSVQLWTGGPHGTSAVTPRQRGRLVGDPIQLVGCPPGLGRLARFVGKGGGPGIG